MADLNPTEQLVVKALQDLGATKDSSIKTADDITKKCNRPKGLVNNTLVALVQKGVIKRVAREKASGYYILGEK
ncbi:transcriptional regulator [Candidatus Marsarchaeota archaeon]|jgi:predicted transcriptional regulator|nr:transcriptional regulator [Candidatus Marsarchaeota archaeon]MCL5099735.1 transcriptional regulator [Candidatus Marsarchaeota archaeon]